MDRPNNHVAVCAFPFGTHATPLLRLVQRLSSASPNTRFSFLNAAHSNAALFATAVDDDANIVACNVSVDDDVSDAANADVVVNPFERFVLCAPKCFRRRIEEVEVEVGLKITCVISDAFFWFCGEIARDKGLPWIPVWTANVVSLSAHFYTDLLRTKFGILQPGNKEREDALVDCVPGFSNIHLKDLSSGIIAGDTDSPFSQMLHKMGLMLPKAHAVVVNSFEKLSPTITNDLKSKMNLLCVGPLPLISSPRVPDFDKFSCLPWLDKQKEKSVVYISFGTVAAPPPDEIVAIAEALGGSGIPFLWSLDDSKKAHLPSWFIDRVREDENFGKIVSWAPQMKLLGHPSVGGFVTHCGWNSILESIINGVPLICKPMLGDQMVNRRFIESVLKVGVGIEGGACIKSGMTNALHQVFLSDEEKEMRKNVEVLRELAEESTKLGGSSIENLNALIEIVTNPHQG